MNIRFAMIPTIFCLLTACSTLSSLKLAEAPQQLKGRKIQLTVERPPKESISTGSYVVPERSVYVKQTGGASAATVLLFGALGALANEANSSRITEELGKSGQKSDFYELDAIREFKLALNNVGHLQGDKKAFDSSDIKVSPYIILYFDDDRKGIHTIAGMRVEASFYESDGIIKKWAGNYNYAVAQVHDTEAIRRNLPNEEFEKYREEIRNGYRQLHSELLSDLAQSKNVKRKAATVMAPLFRATPTGYGGGYSGDIDLATSGRLALRVNLNNFAAVDKSTPYIVWVFPSANQYKIEDAPVERT